MRRGSAGRQSGESNRADPYRAFLEAKVVYAVSDGYEIAPDDIHPILKPHQRDIVRWAVRGGRRAIFASFGLGKSLIQIEIVRLIAERAGGRGLIVLPLGVRQEFTRDARMVGVSLKFIRRMEEAEDPRGLYLTNYETVRDAKLDPTQFVVTSLDEASVLRGFGGTKTFREFMRRFEGSGKFRFVATATPDPNEYIELLAYAAFLDVMDVSASKTRFFKRDSTQADHLTLHPHKEREFWLWVASWAMFLQKPSDLGYSDEGYALPPMEVRWHEIPSDHASASPEKWGQGRLFPEATHGVTEAAREKRDSLAERIAKLMELRAEDPGAHRVIWHDLEAERHAIEAAIPGATTIYGAQDLEDREDAIIRFSDGEIAEFAAKPVIAGSGCNFQRHCAWAIFLGIGFKFNDFIQACHRIYRFLQECPVRIDLIYTEAERPIRQILEAKWVRYTEQVARMGQIIREYGLAEAALASAHVRSMDCKRVEIAGEGYRLILNDAVEETRSLDTNSVDLIISSIPFSTQYEYSPSYRDFGHSDDNEHFWQQMDFLTPELLRVLRPGRVAAIHVKDRVTPGGITGLGFQTIQPFHAEAIFHYRRHGFAFLGMKTIVTDVVRENNQTYRLGWTEQCKDGSKMGAGMPEYLLLFRKPPTDSSNGYADVPVVKTKKLWSREGQAWAHEYDGYSRARWQLDAHGFTRSNGNRPLAPEDLVGLPSNVIYKMFRKFSLSEPYDFERHVELAESLEARGQLPSGFMLLPPQSWHPDVWTDVARMRTLNMMQERKGQQMHLCLARDSLVLTRGGYTPIQDVPVGADVLTHKGRWRPVLAVENTGRQRVVTVKAHGVPGLTLTPDHSLWTRPTRYLAWSQCHSRREARNTEPRWVRADDTLGGYLNLQLPSVEPPSVPQLRHWWVVGRWLADGHIDAHGGVMLSCGRHEVSGLVALLGEYYGVPPYDTRSGMQFRLRDPAYELRRTLKECGHGAAGKHLPPEAYTLPVEQARALLDGYLSGDGHYVPQRRRWMASSVSRGLLLGLAMLAQRAYSAVASVYPGRPGGPDTIQGRAVTAKREWILSFDVPDATRKNGFPFIADDGAWKRVRSIVEAGEVETWNLRVAEDESYTAEGCIVKNCPLQFDIVDRLITQFSMPREMILDPFAGLMTVPYCAVRLGRLGVGIELNAGYFRDGALYVESAARQATVPTLFDLAPNDVEETEETKEEL